MGNITIYPFDSYSVPYIRHSKLIPNEKIVGVVSPEGWGLNGMDANIFDGGSRIGLIVNNDFDNAINDCDTVLFAQTDVELDFSRYIYPRIEIAINRGKNIINTLSLNSEIIKEIQNKCLVSNLCFKNYNLSKCKNDYNNILIENEYIFDIKKPVIFVLGLCEGMDKYEIQLTLREKFLKEGYKISQVGSRNCCEFLGFHSFPNFMYSKNISESNKVVLFNHYIKQIEEKENPDVFIIGIPGGIMQYNKTITNKFGILAYEVCQAVTPDAAVLSTYYQDDYTYFERLSNSIKYKLGIEVSCFNISNKRIDFSEHWNDFKMHFITVDNKYIESNLIKFKSFKIPLFNIISQEDKNGISEYIINTLNSYACTEIV